MHIEILCHPNAAAHASAPPTQPQPQGMGANQWPGVVVGAADWQKDVRGTWSQTGMNEWMVEWIKKTVPTSTLLLDMNKGSTKDQKFHPWLSQSVGWWRRCLSTHQEGPIQPINAITELCICTIKVILVFPLFKLFFFQGLQVSNAYLQLTAMLHSHICQEACANNPAT